MTDVKNLEEQGISSESLYRGVIIDVYRDTVRLPDGNEAFRELIRHNGAVCVVPLTDAGEVLCVRQYRYPFGRVTVEIPAGKLDSPDEDHREAALRELREETGASCEELVFIGWYTTGEVFRSGCCFHRGHGRIFYFQPGHETGDSFFVPEVRRIYRNAARWAAPVLRVDEVICPWVAPLENVTE